MKYLKLKSHVASQIDLKTFDYPRLTCYKGTDRDGYWEEYNLLKAFTCVPYGVTPITLYYSTSFENADQVFAEVDAANRDLKKFWDEQLSSVLEDEQARLKAEIARVKAEKKRIKKMQKKLGKDS